MSNHFTLEARRLSSRHGGDKSVFAELGVCKSRRRRPAGDSKGQAVPQREVQHIGRNGHTRSAVSWRRTEPPLALAVDHHILQAVDQLHRSAAVCRLRQPPFAECE